MPLPDETLSLDQTSTSLAFSKQSAEFDSEDVANPVLQEWRKQIYDHVLAFLPPNGRILELNAGTGIDALHFAQLGYTVHATDLSEGMVKQLHQKISAFQGTGLSCQRVSYERLDLVTESGFDFVFSNFGGLNCIRDLSLVARHLPEKLKPGAYLTWVIMPPFCPWELLWLLKGKWGEATRRFHKEGTRAHVGGEYFQTYYHSLGAVRKALGTNFTLVRAEGLGVLSSPPAATQFYRRFPVLYKVLRSMDQIVKDSFPFNRWGDHIIVTFRKIRTS